MATLHTVPSPFTIWLNRPATRLQFPAISLFKYGPKVSPVSSDFRCKNTVILQIRQRSFTAFAPSYNSGGDSPEEKSGESSDVDQGPPLLTIVAGFLMFFLVGWIIISVISWLIGLLVNLSPFK